MGGGNALQGAHPSCLLCQMGALAPSGSSSLVSSELEDSTIISAEFISPHILHHNNQCACMSTHMPDHQRFEHNSILDTTAPQSVVLTSVKRG